MLKWALEDNFCPRRGRTAENILKEYKALLAAEGLKISARESFDFSQGAYIGLMVMEGILRGTEHETLKKIITKVTE